MARSASGRHAVLELNYDAPRSGHATPRAEWNLMSSVFWTTKVSSTATPANALGRSLSPGMPARIAASERSPGVPDRLTKTAG
jgi:hypothetical protein